MNSLNCYLLIVCSTLAILTTSCKTDLSTDSTYYPTNSLDYIGSPDSSEDRSILAYSDMGAWFAYSMPTDHDSYGGFSGPLLMTQGNGIWCSKALSKLDLVNTITHKPIDWASFKITQTSWNSHLQQVYKNENFEISQTLFFLSSQSAMILTDITNVSDVLFHIAPTWSGAIWAEGIEVIQQDKSILLQSSKSNARGKIKFYGDEVQMIEVSDNAYALGLDTFVLKAGESKKLMLSHSFTFPEYDGDDIDLLLQSNTSQVMDLLDTRINQKKAQLEGLYNNSTPHWNKPIYKDLIAKSVLTLQNNWRVAAGQLNHSGLFPSYHYKWFHGFWAWDSWKHAAALAHYDTQLAREQIRAMYDYQTEDGFIPDCIFRDTTIEQHNYRNTKPPLSAWAVWKVYEHSQDVAFLGELYPKIVKQHYWWYAHRDNDNDGLCEYGSTDGSLIAAKWESGMDNAVRFDESEIVQNSVAAFSLNQESVDLNAYLFAEKKYLSRMAIVLHIGEDATSFDFAAQKLKKKIQNQFYDPDSGWFYDTSLDGKKLITVMGCEGWIPLWAEVATKEQAESVKNTMMDTAHFYTHVPFQTLSASHPQFNPNRGYWRGPNWLDQSYFGIKGLHNYGYHNEAHDATYKLMHNAEGVLAKGMSIRENYQPLTGEGLESENFSWSAAHYLMLLIGE